MDLSGPAVDRAVEAALREADAYMAGTAKVQLAAAALAKRFQELGIDYAIAGAIALDVHGVRRLTVDVDVLLRREDLVRFKEHWLGRGYVELFPGSKGVRDTEHGVKIDFLITGDFPGDGKPKPVAFPDPARVRLVGDRFAVLRLETLIELKLASGMTAPHRGQDLVDAQRLVHDLRLARELGEKLDPFVRAKYDEIWQLAQHPDDD